MIASVSLLAILVVGGVADFSLTMALATLKAALGRIFPNSVVSKYNPSGTALQVTAAPRRPPPTPRAPSPPPPPPLLPLARCPHATPHPPIPHHPRTSCTCSTLDFQTPSCSASPSTTWGPKSSKWKCYGSACYSECRCGLE